ncbi:MAG TPA: RNA polymerase sporulation sigma factor SigK [Firmicutes bacterium]|nr:RNA polymerase sporulation sigma factor SigK [Bacillota bacterium]HHY97978.1 RNA polymerase sporulation sigma factor SigK [Bacillota bacterium]
MLPAAIALGVSLIRGLFLLVSYVTSGNIFPDPLTEEEEARLLELKEKGDEEARNTLVERNLRLVAHIVKKFDGKAEEIDDLISIGTIGLVKAIDTFNKKKKTRLATYAARCIENEILMHMRSVRKNRGELFLYDTIGADKEGNEITLMDVLSSEGDDISESVEVLVEEQKLQDRVGRLSLRERKVIEMRYGLLDGISRTQREVSKKLGISRSYVSRIEKRAIGKLQKYMMADECH